MKLFTKKNPLQNPYVKGAEGRREWNDRYMNMSHAIKLWQWAFFGALSLSVISVAMVVKLASESKIKPYIIETNQGVPLALQKAIAIPNNDARVINFAVDQFIINTRTILADNDAQKILLDKAYAYAANNTISFLTEFYKKNNPLELNNQYSVTVNIFNSQPLGNNIWQVTWDETKKNINGGNMGTTRWMANVTYKFGEVSEEFITNNPFGIYITDVIWSQNQLATNDVEGSHEK